MLGTGKVKRILFGTMGGLVGALVGGLLAAVLFFIGVGLVATGGSPGPRVGGYFLPLLAAVGAPCMLGGVLLFAFPPARLGALGMRLLWSALVAALYAAGWVVVWGATGSRNAGVAILLITGTLLVPLWLLAATSLGVGLTFFRSAQRR
jgi:hypothetical protein